jgi:hypothetical protein
VLEAAKKSEGVTPSCLDEALHGKSIAFAGGSLGRMEESPGPLRRVSSPNKSSRASLRPPASGKIAVAPLSYARTVTRSRSR